MFRLLLTTVLLAVPALAQCRLPDVAPDALARLTPEQLVDAGHFLRAEQILDPIVKAFPDDAPAMWLLSRAKAALGEFDDAMKLAEGALAANPSNAAYHVQVAAVAGRIAEKASLLKQLTFAKRARQELDAAVALDPANTDAQWGLMMYFYVAPSLLGGDKNRAAQIGEQLAAFSPDLGRYYQGRLATQMKDADKAEAFYRQSALEIPCLSRPQPPWRNFTSRKSPIRQGRRSGPVRPCIPTRRGPMAGRYSPRFTPCAAAGPKPSKSRDLPTR